MHIVMFKNDMLDLIFPAPPKIKDMFASVEFTDDTDIGLVSVDNHVKCFQNIQSKH